MTDTTNLQAAADRAFEAWLAAPANASRKRKEKLLRAANAAQRAYEAAAGMVRSKRGSKGGQLVIPKGQEKHP
jgi:hypothetical protein